MRFSVALGVSVCAHLLLAVVLGWCFTLESEPIVLAQLDLSSVELSLAEEDVSTAVPVASLPSATESVAERSVSETPKTPEPTPDVLDPTMPVLREPVAPEVRPEVPELPKVKEPVRPEPSRKETARPDVSHPESSAAAQVAPKQARVDAPPSPKRAIRPDYPRGARLRKEEGDVVLEIGVTATGDVGNVRVAKSSGFEELDAAAVASAKAARFTPAKSGTESVASVARLTLSFKLK